MVFGRLLPLSTRLQQTAYRLPEGERIYAIGDIHGRRDLFAQLRGMIEEDHAARGAGKYTLILLGDLIDRGPESRGVIEDAIALSTGPTPCIFLMGNHEESLIRVWEGDESVTASFLRHGGDALLCSYGVAPDAPALAQRPPAEIIDAVRRHVPEAHIRFLQSFQQIHQEGDYVFVHAGVRPGIPISAQDPVDLRWIRGDFTRSTADFGAMIVHGHSITPEPDVKPNRIGIDTGAYQSGHLTALGLEGNARWLLST